MFLVKNITNENIDDLQFAYNDFYLSAKTHYDFEITPLDFNDVKMLVQEGIFNILGVYEKTILKGFLIYNIVLNVAEVTIMHCFLQEKDINGQRIELIKALKSQVAEKNCKLISYAMVGVQADFVKEIAPLGFEFVGQAITAFDLSHNSISRQIFEKVSPQYQELGENFKIINWDEKYAHQIVNLIYESFKNMQDKKFDPRFDSLGGCEDILVKIIQDVYGAFLPNHTKILLENDTPKGFCFANLTMENIANIPIIGIAPSLKYKGFGQKLLSRVVVDMIKSVDNKELSLLELNATFDTDNLPSISLYRNLGFKERCNYPQAFCEL